MLKIGAIVWGVTDINRGVGFWSKALDYVPKYPPEHDFAILIPQEGKDGFQLSLNRVTSPHPRRHHMDLFTTDQAGEVQRLIGLGARRKPWNYEEGADYVVLEDPDGNPFCVIQLP
ncbi:MAG: VOC family protein [Anaerolineaceae bacterium]|jgi:hypothetical protein